MDAVDCVIPKCFWTPTPGNRTQFDSYRERINTKFGFNFTTYAEVYDWSIENYRDYWEEFWHFSGLICSEKYEEVIDTNQKMSTIPQWFKGSRLNYAENLLRHDTDRVAIYASTEGGHDLRSITFRQLRTHVATYAAALRKLGVKTDDRVIGYLPNGIEAVEVMLAVSSIGAVWSCASPDFGAAGVLDRFSQIRPCVLFSVDAVRYNGKVHSHMTKLAAVADGLPDLRAVIVLSSGLVDGADILNKIPKSQSLEDFLQTGLNQSDGLPPPLTFEQLPCDHPLFIMFSSGTTGPPKCIVHSAGGTLLKHLSEHLLQGNMNSSDIIMYYTTTGWMMWNWFVSCLAVGASIVCYDGSPLVPTADTLWNLIDQIGITVLGTGAKWLSVLEERHITPMQSHNLSTLHSILSTGSPLKPQTFDYVYSQIKHDVLLGSITGGTDIIGCFAGHSWNVPVFRGEIQCRMLGMGMKSWDEQGHDVLGEPGELVCVVPFPSMPVFFWNDPDGSKYRSAYFDKFPDVWAHGDFCLINPHTGGVWMLGRSDATLNPNGVRFGSAEIYQVVESFKEIADSLCVAQQSRDKTDERVVLFIKLAQDVVLPADLVKRVQDLIRVELSARHVPAVIISVQDIPYTLTGKKVELAVKTIISGGQVKSRSSLSNPDSLDLYYHLPQLNNF